MVGFCGGGLSTMVWEVFMVGYCGGGLSTMVWLGSDYGRLLWWGSVHHGVVGK